MEPDPTARKPDGTLAASISIPSRQSSFAEANRWFEEFLLRAEVHGNAAADLLLVFEEAVINAILHAYRGSDGDVAIVAERTAESVVLTVSENGPPFDPLAQPAPRLDLPVAERPIGGLGILLVRTLCDEVRYQRRGESNILVMTKSIPRQEEGM